MKNAWHFPSYRLFEFGIIIHRLTLNRWYIVYSDDWWWLRHFLHKLYNRHTFVSYSLLFYIPGNICGRTLILDLPKIKISAHQRNICMYIWCGKSLRIYTQIHVWVRYQFVLQLITFCCVLAVYWIPDDTLFFVIYYFNCISR